MSGSILEISLHIRGFFLTCKSVITRCILFANRVGSEFDVFGVVFLLVFVIVGFGCLVGMCVCILCVGFFFCFVFVFAVLFVFLQVGVCCGRVGLFVAFEFVLVSFF